jgi:hypothetical protein
VSEKPPFGRERIVKRPLALARRFFPKNVSRPRPKPFGAERLLQTVSRRLLKNRVLEILHAAGIFERHLDADVHFEERVVSEEERPLLVQALVLAVVSEEVQRRQAFCSRHVSYAVDRLQDRGLACSVLTDENREWGKGDFLPFRTETLEIPQEDSTEHLPPPITF